MDNWRFQRKCPNATPHQVPGPSGASPGTSPKNAAVARKPYTKISWSDFKGTPPANARKEEGRQLFWIRSLSHMHVQLQWPAPLLTENRAIGPLFRGRRPR